MVPTYGHVEVGVSAGPVGDSGEGVGHQHILYTKNFIIDNELNLHIEGSHGRLNMSTRLTHLARERHSQSVEQCAVKQQQRT
jgi:hypothetical protein